MLLVATVLTGRVMPFGGATSAIGKVAVDGPCAVTPLGLASDEQADHSVHGGPDKAIHHYPRDHYPGWAQTLGPHPLLAAAGAFGENISTTGLIEDAVCIGDRYRLGTALVEVAQGRQPCWKQGHRLDDPAVLAAMVRTARCGWYYRVIEPGHVAAGDALTLAARPHPDWTVARVIALLLGGGAKQDPAAVRALAALDVLAVNWRARAAKLSSGT